MVKVYRHQVGKRYMKGYGVVKTIQHGDGFAEVAVQGAKILAKKGIPVLKKIWSRMSPQQREEILESGISLGNTAVGAVGDRIERGVGQLSEVATQKLEGLLGKPASKRMSGEAKKVMKKMLKEAKQTAVKKVKKTKLPKELTKKEQERLTQASVNTIGKLLAAR
jgi:hypothetical protein